MQARDAQIDYLILGHVTHDLTAGGPRPGGTATYAALTARALGSQVAIVTAGADDAPSDALAGFAAVRLPSAQTTIFENIYYPGGRTQFLRGRAACIRAADVLDRVPRAWRGAPLVHLAPVAGEVDPALVSYFPDSFVGLTPQGWLRAWDETGRVRPCEWRDAAATLRAAGAAVISRDDVSGDDEIIGAWARTARFPLAAERRLRREIALAVTDGPGGATVLWRGERRRFPAPAVREVDPTGAGDIFAAAFFVRMRETGDAWRAARFAVALASASVTRLGLEGIPQPDEVDAARWTTS